MKKNHLFLVGGIILLFTAIGFFWFLPLKIQKISNEKNLTAASFYPLYFFSNEIAGDLAEVINITPAGVEPHDYELTPKDAALIENSRLLIVNGGDLESWLENMQKNLDQQKTKIVVAGKGLFEEQNREGKMVLDPHIWLSPYLAQKMADAIAQGFIQIDPANAKSYQAGATQLKSKLDSLDKKYGQELQNCKKKDIVTSHQAFSYLVSLYGFRQIPIAGLTPDAEPSAQEFARLASFIKSNNIEYIFFEELASPKFSQTLALETGAKTLALNPLEGLTDQEISQGKDYFSVMEENLNNLKIALQCQP